MIRYKIANSTIGEILLLGNDGELLGVYFVGGRHALTVRDEWIRDDDHPLLASAATQIAEYLAGERETFSVPLGYEGTDFQKRVWGEISKLTFGETISYGELANRVGSPKAVRAVGTATGRNPLSIIIPCHRIVGKDNSLTGYAGGLERKRHLLTLERIG